MTGFMWPQLPAVSIWKNQKLSIGGLDEIAFWNKRRGRRFVNLALKENNPLCHEHLILSHHTEDKYHSIHVAGWWFPWSFWSSCDLWPLTIAPINHILRQVVQQFLPQPLPLTFLRLSNVSCMECLKARLLFSHPSVSSFQWKSHKSIFVFQSYLVWLLSCYGKISYFWLTPIFLFSQVCLKSLSAPNGLVYMCFCSWTLDRVEWYTCCIFVIGQTWYNCIRNG